MKSKFNALVGATAVFALLPGGSLGAAADILGQRPSYTDKTPGVVPNAAAIDRRLWAPGLDDGFVPQGLTMADGRLLLVAYQSTDAKPEAGLSRVFELDPDNGKVTGRFDLPAEVGHPGGLAFGEGALFVADGGKLLRIDLRRSVSEGRAVLTGRRAVAPAMGPSFLTYWKGDLWFGPFLRKVEPTLQLYRVPVARIFVPGAQAPVRATDATRHIPLPLLAQGATFDGDGRLWVSASVQREGWLYRLDPEDGRMLGRYPMPPGIEDLAPGARGRLWAVGESGSKRWLASPTFYPLLFEFAPERLVAAP